MTIAAVQGQCPYCMRDDRDLRSNSAVERIVRCIFFGNCPVNTIDCEETNGHYKCEHRVVGEMVRIRYWQQETMESGGWRLTGLMPAEMAKKMTKSTILEQPHIVEDNKYT